MRRWQCKTRPVVKNHSSKRPTAISCGVKEQKGVMGCEIKSFLFGKNSHEFSEKSLIL
jgi:hypothetical protein